jgi:hypothetical protein
MQNMIRSAIASDIRLSSNDALIRTRAKRNAKSITIGEPEGDPRYGVSIDWRCQSGLLLPALASSARLPCRGLARPSPE